MRAEDGAFARTATADANGHYMLPGLPAGEYKVVASLSGNAAALVAGVAVSAGVTTAGVDLSLLQPGAIAVTVTDAEGGGPVAAATVTPAVPATVSAQTDTAGQATLADMPPGPVAVEVRATAYLFYTATVTVSAGGTAPLNVALTPAGTVAGQVQSPGHGPLEGVPVTIVGNGAAFPATVTTNSAGQYSFSGAPVGPFYVALGRNGAAIVGR